MRYFIIFFIIAILFMIISLALSHSYRNKKIKFNTFFVLGFITSIIILACSIYGLIGFIFYFDSLLKVIFIPVSLYLIKTNITFITSLIKTYWTIFTEEVCIESVKEITRLAESTIEENKLNKMKEQDNIKKNKILDFLDFLDDYSDDKEVLEKVNNIRNILNKK